MQVQSSKTHRLRKARAIVALSAAGALAITALPESAHAFASVRFAIQEICGHIQGNLGGLLMTVAGVGALISAAFGNMRAMQSMIVVGVGAITVSSLLSLYFTQAANICRGQGKSPRVTRTLESTNTGLEERTAIEAPQLGIDPAALNTALNREVDFSKAAGNTAPAANAAEEEEEADGEVFQNDFDTF